MKKRLVSFVLIFAMFFNLVGVIPSFADLNTPEVSTGDVSEITASRAVVFGSILKNGGANITDCGIIYGTQSKYSNELLFANCMNIFKNELKDFTFAMEVNTDASVETINATDINTTTAILSLNVLKNGGFNITDYGFLVGTSSSQMKSYPQGYLGDNKGIYRKKFTGLSPNTKYFYQVYVATEKGTFKGELKDFTSAMEVNTDASVETINATDINTTTAILSLNVLKNGGFNITDYGFLVGTSSSQMKSYPQGYLGDNKGIYRKKFTGLSPNTKYFYQVYVATEKGTFKGELKDFTSAMEVNTDASVETINATDINTTTAILSLNVLKNGGFNITDYGFLVGTSSSQMKSYPQGYLGDNKGIYRKKFTELSPNTKYFYQVYVATEKGTFKGELKDFTSAMEVNTDASVETINATDINTTTAILSLNVLKNGGFNITDYGFLVGTSSSQMKSYPQGYLGDNKGIYRKKFTELSPNTKYFYQVYVTTEKGTFKGELKDFTSAMEVNTDASVETINATDINTTTAILSLNVLKNGGFNITDYGFLVGTSSSQMKSYPQGYLGDNKGIYRKKFTELSPNTKYFYQVYVTTEKGTFKGELKDFTSAMEVNTDASVETINATDINTTTAILSLNVLKNGGFNITDYGFLVGTSSSQMKSYPQGYLGDNKGIYRKKFTELSPNTKYFYQVYVTTEKGTFKGELKDFTSAMKVNTDASVETINATDINTTTAILSLNVLKNGGFNITDYGFLVGTSSSQMKSYPQGYLGDNKGIYRKKFTELSPNTKYFYQVYVTTEKGTFKGELKDFTSAMEVNTDASVETINATDINTTTAILSLNVLKNGGFNITDYGFLVGTSSSQMKSYPQGYLGDNKGIYRKKFTGLSPNTKYFYQVYVTTEKGTFKGELKDFTSAMEVNRDASVETINATDINTTTAILSLNVLENGGFNITDYGFLVGTSSSQMKSYPQGYLGDNKGIYRKKFTGLSPNTKYFYQVYATTEKGTFKGELKDFTSTMDSDQKSINSHPIELNIVYNNTPITFETSTGKPFIDNQSRTQVPIKTTLNKLGLIVTWNPKNNSVIISSPISNKILEVPIGKSIIYVNGIEKKIDSCAIIKDSKSYIPISEIVQEFGYYVNWDSSKKSVVISKPIESNYTNQLDDMSIISQIKVNRDAANTGYSHIFEIKTDDFIDLLEVYIDNTKVGEATLIKSNKNSKISNYKYSAIFNKSGIHEIKFVGYVNNNSISEATTFIHSYNYNDHVALSNISVVKVNDINNTIAFNAYTNYYSISAIEVFDSNGDLLDVKEIDGLDIPDGVWQYLFKSMFWDAPIGVVEIFNGDVNFLTSDVNSKKTKIEITVPIDGYFVIKQSAESSANVLILNYIDIFFKTAGIIEDTVSMGNDTISLSKWNRAASKIPLGEYSKKIMRNDIFRDSILNGTKVFSDIDSTKVSESAKYIYKLFLTGDVNILQIIYDVAIEYSDEISIELGKSFISSSVSTGEDIATIIINPYGYLAKEFGARGIEFGEVFCQCVSLERLANTKDIIFQPLNK